MQREVIRVEPLYTYLERWKAPTSAVTRHGDTIYVSGFPPFDPQTGEVVDAPIERQTELVLEQLKLCVETAGSSLGNALKCNVYCTSVEKFAAVNAIYARYFPKDPPARIFVCVGIADRWKCRSARARRVCEHKSHAAGIAERFAVSDARRRQRPRSPFRVQTSSCFDLGAQSVDIISALLF